MTAPHIVFLQIMSIVSLSSVRCGQTKNREGQSTDDYFEHVLQELPKHFRTFTGTNSRASFRSQDFSLPSQPSLVQIQKHNLPQQEWRIAYLSHYGYLDLCQTSAGCSGSYTSLLQSEVSVVFEAGVKRFQHTWNLDETGIVHDMTARIMMQPRCGNSDASITSATHRNRRYVLAKPWRHGILKYKITSYPQNGNTRITQEEIREIHKQAFSLWEANSGLNMTHVDEGAPADIEIGWVMGDHYDGRSFSGSTSYAHSFFPPVGYLHYNDEQAFSKDCCQAGSWHLLQVATHEIGHLLGLDHTQNPDSLMFPFYRADMQTVELQKEDQAGVVALYGKEGVSTTAPPLSTTTTEFPASDFCPDAGPSRGVAVSAVTTAENGNVIFFRGNLVARVDDFGILNSYPRHISTEFPDFEGHVDCVLYLPVVYERRYCSDARNCFDVLDEGGTYLFQGSWYYLYQHGNFVAKKYIFTKFNGLPSPVTAAFTKQDSHIYFIVGEDVYSMERRQSNKQYHVRSFYPKKLAELYPSLKGVPVTDAILMGFYENGNLVLFNYFFTGKNYYRFRELQKTIDRPDASTPEYPRPLDPWWLKCYGDNPGSTQGKLEASERTITRLNSFFRSDEGYYVPAESVEDISDLISAFSASSRSHSYASVAVWLMTLWLGLLLRL